MASRGESVSRGDGRIASASGGASIRRKSMNMGRMLLGREAAADDDPPTMSRTSLEMAQHFTGRSARVSFAIERAKKSPVDLKKEIDMWEHKVSVPELCRKLDSHMEKGMTSVVAEKKLALYGPNLLTRRRRCHGTLSCCASLQTFSTCYS
jgi:Cation transporter/ATPase, N-terminus